MPSIHCPVPPSTNRLWRMKQRADGKPTLHKSESYRKWLGDFASRVMAIRHRSITGPYCVTLIANIDRDRDLDNLIKPSLDALQRAGCITDDNMVDEVIAKRLNGDISLNPGWMSLAWMSFQSEGKA